LPNTFPGRSFRSVSTLVSRRMPCARCSLCVERRGGQSPSPPVTRPHLAVPGWPLTPIEVGG
jgi:hypothetical protein